MIADVEKALGAKGKQKGKGHGKGEHTGDDVDDSTDAGDYGGPGKGNADHRPQVYGMRWVRVDFSGSAIRVSRASLSRRPFG